MADLSREKLLRQLRIWIISCRKDEAVGSCKNCQCKETCKEALDQIRKLIQRKVGREWLNKQAEKLVNRFHGEVKLSDLQYIGILTVLTEKGDLEDLLINLGYKVEK